MAIKLKKLDAEVKRLGLRGTRRHTFLCQGLGLDERRGVKRISRLRKEFGN